MPNGQPDTFLKPEEKEFQKVYERSLWWINHRNLFKNIGLIILAVFDAGLLLYTGWVLLDTYALSFGKEQTAVANLVLTGQSELHDFSDTVAAKPLTFGEVFVTPAGDQKNYDLSVLISNSNTDWYATFTYSFVLKDGETASQSGFILPSEERPLVLLQATESKPTTVSLNLSDVQWHRVDPHEIYDYPTWGREHLNLPLSDVSFARETDTSAVLSFTVENASAYSYWQPSFVAVLWRGSAIGGVMRLTTAGLTSGEEKQISARWLGTVPAVTKVEVYPEINIFSTDAYSSLQGENPEDIRTKFRTSH